MKKTDRVMTVEKGQRLTHRVYFTEGISPTIVTPGGGAYTKNNRDERRT